MKKEMITLGIFIFLIGIISAYYPGDSFYVNNNLQTTNLSYTIIQNNTPINGIGLEINKYRIKITLPTDIHPVSFSILFVSKENHQQMKVKVKRYYWYYPPKRNWYYFWWKKY